MKTALIIIPTTGESVNRQAYIGACIDFVEQEGYSVDCPALLEGYTNISASTYLDKRIAWADSIFFFTDFGIDGIMLDVAERLVKAGRESAVIYKKLQKVDNVFTEPLQILRDVSRRTGISLEQLTSKTRKREVVDARFVYFLRCRNITKASLASIGLPVGKDHASVLHGIREANKTPQVIELYNKCYYTKSNGETASKKKTVEQLTRDCRSVRQEGERSVLSQQQMEEGEPDVPRSASTVRSVPARGFYGAFAGYRSHNS